MRRAACCAATLAASLLGVAAFAQTGLESSSQATTGEQHTTGMVEAISPTTLVLASDFGLKDFAITDQSLLPRNLAVGDNARIWYKAETVGGPATFTRVGQAQQNPANKTVTTAQASSAGTATAALPTATETASEQAAAAQASAPTASEVASGPAAPVAGTEVASVAPSRARTRLPQTASSRPLIGLIGLLSLAGAGALRLVRA